VNYHRLPRFSAFTKLPAAFEVTSLGRFRHPSHWRLTRCGWVCVSLVLLSLGSMAGCNVFGKKDNADLSGAVSLRGSDSADVFQRVREAKAQNSIVLQVTGDSSPVRILPLPPDDRSVFVSDLLKQTEIQDKVGPMRVTLYRASDAAPMGIPMEVKFTTRGGSVRPDSDYALKAGDRLRILKDERSAMSGMLNQFFPTKGS